MNEVELTLYFTSPNEEKFLKDLLSQYGYSVNKTAYDVFPYIVATGNSLHAFNIGWQAHYIRITHGKNANCKV